MSRQLADEVYEQLAQIIEEEAARLAASSDPKAGPKPTANAHTREF